MEKEGEIRNKFCPNQRIIGVCFILTETLNIAVFICCKGASKNPPNYYPRK